MHLRVSPPKSERSGRERDKATILQAVKGARSKPDTAPLTRLLECTPLRHASPGSSFGLANETVCPRTRLLNTTAPCGLRVPPSDSPARPCLSRRLESLATRAVCCGVPVGAADKSLRRAFASSVLRRSACTGTCVRHIQQHPYLGGPAQPYLGGQPCLHE